MSAELLALAARAAAHYAGVRGPWLKPTTMVLEPDCSRPGRLVVRDSHPARSRDALLFDPLPRKETAMPMDPKPGNAIDDERLAPPPAPPEGRRPHGVALHLHLNISLEVPVRVHPLPARHGVAPSVILTIGNGDCTVDISIWDAASVMQLQRSLETAAGYFEELGT
jgi:hypothetical protein